MSHGNVHFTVTLPASRNVGEMLLHGGKIVELEALNRNRELERSDAFRWRVHKCDKFYQEFIQINTEFCC